MLRTAEAVAYINEKLPQSVIDEMIFLGETTLQVRKELLKNVLKLLKGSDVGFEVLIDLTGVDYLHSEGHRTKLVYLLHHPTNYARLRITLYVGRDESVPTVTDLWEGADWYERELYDLFGIKFEGHPDLKRLLLPDEWIGHPLRRNYALSEESVEFKHGVKPKVPSEIIPHVKYREQIQSV